MYQELWKMPDPSSARVGTHFIEESGRTCIVICNFSPDSTHSYRIRFEGVECYRGWYDATCRLELISEGYDRVTEVLQSDWKDEAIRALKKWGRDVSGLKHLMIYFDDGPAYEFICRSFEAEAFGMSPPQDPTDAEASS